MKKHSIFSMVVASLILGSCSNETNNPEMDYSNGDGKANFNINVASLSRTATDGLQTTFEPDDQIGIYGTNETVNTPITLQGTTWTGDVFLPLTGQTATYYGYYPYNESISATEYKFDYSVATDQSTDYNDSDLLLAKSGDVSSSDRTIQLTFKHALALVEVNAESFEQEITGIEFKARTDATVDLNASTATLKSNVPVRIMKMCKVTNKVYRAVVPAQTLSAGSHIFINTASSSFEISTTETEVKAGNINKFTLGTDGSASFSSEIDAWGENGTNSEDLESKSVENLVKLGIEDMVTGNIAQASGYNKDIPVDTWFKVMPKDFENTVEIVSENEENALHVKLAQDVNNKNIYDIQVGYHATNPTISKYKLTFKAKSTAQIDVKWFVYDKVDKTEHWFLCNNDQAYELTKTIEGNNEYKEYEGVFNFGKYSTSPWSLNPKDNTEAINSVLVSFWFNHKAGEVWIKDLTFKPVTEEVTE